MSGVCDDNDTTIRRISLGNGLQVGIRGLDGIMQDIADLEFEDAGDIEKELLSRVRSTNFVAQGAEKEYAVALMTEYNRKFDESAEPERIEPKKHHSF